MKLCIMGSGTSFGVPVIACDCYVCKSNDDKDKRYRASAFVTDGQKNIVVDIGPEFRLQAIRQGFKTLDALLLSHGHADHISGLDDIRRFSSTKQNGVWYKETTFLDCLFNRHSGGLKVFACKQTKKTILTRFDYIFKKTQKGGGKPRVDLWNVEKFSEKNPLIIGSIKIIPIPMKHGKLDSTGYLFCQNDKAGNVHSIAYLTDLNFISQKSIDIINRNKGILEHAVIDALRVKPHSTHFNFEDALTLAQKIKARHTWFTHLTHDLSHEDVQKYIDDALPRFSELEQIVKNGGSVAPCYDTQELRV